MRSGARATGCPASTPGSPRLESLLLDRFARAGYDPLKTPVLEFTGAPRAKEWCRDRGEAVRTLGNRSARCLAFARS